VDDKLTGVVIGAAIQVHKELGPGLLESAYQRCLQYELIQRELHIDVEVPLPVSYKNIKLDRGYRLDLLVENQLVIELKAVESLEKIHTAQLLSYLKLSNFQLGLLINFNEPILKKGIKRVINSKSHT